MPSKYKSRVSWYQEYYKRNKDKNKHNQIKRLYNLTPDQLSNLYIEQNNKCAICNITFISTPHIDHDHITGKVRGLLCRRCNTGLGYYEKYKDLYYKYLKDKYDG